MKHSLVKSNSCAIVALLALVTACGPSDQSNNTAPPPVASKPANLTKDNAVNGYGLLLASAFPYLNDTLYTLFTLEDAVSDCSRRMRRENLPAAPGSKAARSRVSTVDQCGRSANAPVSLDSQVERVYDQVEWVRTVSGLQLRFQRATVSTVQPDQISTPSRGRNPTLTANHELAVTLMEGSTDRYEFQLVSEWRSIDRNGLSPAVGLWITRISGQVQLPQDSLKDLIFSQIIAQVEGNISRRRQGRNDAQTEMAQLSVSAEGSDLSPAGQVRLGVCGHPLTAWQGVYNTSLFPNQQLDLNLKTTDRMLLNSTQQTRQDLASCRPHEVTWAANGLKAYSYFKKVRGL